MNRLVNVILRGMTLVSKFLLIFFLARFLEPAELGLYGLLAATIGYSLYLLGFDFYIFTTREILKRDRDEWGGLLKNQSVLSFILYAIFLPLLTLVFVQGLLPWSVAGWFFVLLVLEHITQELGRLLVAISDQLIASVVLFLRSGIWAVGIAGLMLVEPEFRSLNVVLGAWALGGLLALCLGVWRLTQLRILGWRKRIDWRWIGKGIKIAIPFLLATLAIRGVFTLDRYWFQSLVSPEVLGAYVLFMGFCNALMSFLDAGVLAFSYPGLIRAYNHEDAPAFRAGMHKMLMQTLVLSLVFVVVAVLLIDPLLLWLNRPVYTEHQSLFYWLLLTMVLYALGMVPHFGLYAQGRDRPIIYSHVVSLLVFILATWLFSWRWPYMAVPFGLCVAFTLILLWKTLAFYWLTPLRYRTAKSNIDLNVKQGTH